MNAAWPEVEIKDLPTIKPDQLSQLDMHGLLNVLNVLQGELTLLGLSLASDMDYLKEALLICREMIASLRKRDAALHSMACLKEYRSRLEACIQDAILKFPEQAEQEDVKETLANIQSVFSILEVRAREVMARQESPEAWQSIKVDDLRSSFTEIFSAIEKNSKGRYRIIYNLACHAPTDYFVRFDVESSDRTQIALPPVFLDVMRDLIANARKYTSPGGSIVAGLHEDASVVLFAVEDSGRGIPADEILEVVKFGKRGTNVGQVRTMGGGFGLTKALFVTKQFKGRLWISSCLGQGTRVRIEIPRPAQ